MRFHIWQTPACHTWQRIRVSHMCRTARHQNMSRRNTDASHSPTHLTCRVFIQDGTNQVREFLYSREAHKNFHWFETVFLGDAELLIFVTTFHKNISSSFLCILAFRKWAHISNVPCFVNYHTVWMILWRHFYTDWGVLSSSTKSIHFLIGRLYIELPTGDYKLLTRRALGWETGESFPAFNYLIDAYVNCLKLFIYQTSE